MKVEQGQFVGPDAYIEPKNVLEAVPTALLMAPDGFGQTLLTLEAARRYRPQNELQVLALAPAPTDILEAYEIFTGTDPEGNTNVGWDTTHLLDQYMQVDSGTDPAIIGRALVDHIIFMRNFTGANAVEAIRSALAKANAPLVGVYPNTHAGLELVAAEIVDGLTEFKLGYATPEFVRKTRSKYEFNRFQEDFGYRVPLEDEPIATGDHEQDITAILARVAWIGEKTKGPAAVKPDDLFGSSGFTKFDYRWPVLKQREIAEKHLAHRNENGSAISTVQEFISGQNVGIFITASRGQFHIDYTRKGLATGPDGLNSEEVRHAFDPEDPLHELCQKIFTPKLARMMQECGNVNMSLNADGILDERYFDAAGKVVSLETIEDDNSCIVELQCRQGGEAIPELFSQVYEADWGVLTIRASLGDSDAIAIMNAAKPKNAALLEMGWPDYKGPIIKLPYIAHLHDKPGVFHSALRRLLVNQGLVPVEQSIQRTIDWQTKGKVRTLIGTSGRTMEEAQGRFNSALALVGMLVLSREGVRYFDDQNGYVERKVAPDSPYGRWLQRLGCEFTNEGWAKSATD